VQCEKWPPVREFEKSEFVSYAIRWQWNSTYHGRTRIQWKSGSIEIGKSGAADLIVILENLSGATIKENWQID
jgi:hypothetical protein